MTETTLIGVVTYGSSARQAGKGAAANAKAVEVEQPPEVYTAIHKKKYRFKECPLEKYNKACQATMGYTDGEVDHVERNLLVMSVNPLLDREVWKRRMDEARKRWDKATSSPINTFLTYTAILILGMAFIALCFALVEMMTDRSKREQLHQMLYVWVPLIVLTLIARYL